MRVAIRTVAFLRFADGGGGLQEKGLFPGLQKYGSPEQLISLYIACSSASLAPMAPRVGSPAEGRPGRKSKPTHVSSITGTASQLLL